MNTCDVQAAEARCVDVDGSGDGLEAFLLSMGYTDLCMKPLIGWCGIQRFMFTGGLVIGFTEESYKGRYCYESIEEARECLKAWDGSGDPGGNWIKFKGAGEDRLGPGAVGLYGS